jgi:hypothetical protein
MDREQTRHPTRGQSVCPFLEALAQEVNETIDLATLYGTRVRFIDQVVPGRRLRATSIFGEQFPAHSTANGKALLAELPVPTVEATFPAQLERFTANTITIAAPDRPLPRRAGRVRRRRARHGARRDGLPPAGVLTADRAAGPTMPGVTTAAVMTRPR